MEKNYPNHFYCIFHQIWVQSGPGWPSGSKIYQYFPSWSSLGQIQSIMIDENGRFFTINYAAIDSTLWKPKKTFFLKTLLRIYFKLPTGHFISILVLNSGRILPMHYFLFRSASSPSIQTTSCKNDSYKRDILVNNNFSHARKFIILGLLCRSQFWYFWKRPAVTFSKFKIQTHQAPVFWKKNIQYAEIWPKMVEILKYIDKCHLNWIGV